MDGAPREWWQRVFDGSYRRIYAFMERHTERDLAFLKDVLELRPGMSLLDMCCGYGRHSIPLAEMGLRVMGVDYSSEQLAEAAPVALMACQSLRRSSKCSGSNL